MRGCGASAPCRPDDRSFSDDVWVVGADGSPRFVSKGFNDSPWSWSPTGSQLAYADVAKLILLDPHGRLVVDIVEKVFP